MNKNLKKSIFVLSAFGLVLSLAACNWVKNQQVKQQNTKQEVSTQENMKTGILTDNKWMTLYIFKKDTKNTSNCYWECEIKWPVFYNPDLTGNWYSSIKRKDGKMQTTLNGQPLYYFFKDKKPGEMKWEWLLNLWYTIKK